MDQSHARQCADLGADRALREPGLGYDLIERQSRGGDVEHCEDGSHPFWETPEAADLAESFGEIFFNLFK